MLHAAAQASSSRGNTTRRSRESIRDGSGCSSCEIQRRTVETVTPQQAATSSRVSTGGVRIGRFLTWVMDFAPCTIGASESTGVASSWIMLYRFGA